MSDPDFSDFSEEDIEVAVELGELVKAENQREVRGFLRSLFAENEDG